MATLSITVPDALLPDLTQAFALRMQGTTDAALQAVVTKVLAGEATTAAEKAALGQAFVKEQTRSALQDYRGQQAALAARTDPTVTGW